MSKQEIKTYLISCDTYGCGETAVLSGTAPEWSTWAPEGWGTVERPNCGMTGYSRTDLLCPACLEKAARKKEGS